MRADKSKAFRATLPTQMREDQVRLIQRWANANCALNALFANAAGKLVLIGLRDHERTAASFSRTLRSVLRRYAIDDELLRGKWLSLLSTEEALLMCSGSGIAVETKRLDDTKIVTLR